MLGALRLLADGSGAAGAGLFFILYTAIVVLYIAGLWKIFTKAGQKGWFAIIPILNLYVLIKLAGREGWWIILYLIPCVNIVVSFIVLIDVAKNFGKDVIYGVGMAILPFIFFPMLGFGSATYQGDTTPVL